MSYPSITDPTAPRAPNALEAVTDAWALPYLVDARDVVFVRLFVGILTQLLPLTVVMWLLPSFWVWVFAVPYLAYAFVRFGGPTVLALHAVTHRPLFKKRHRRWNSLITHVLPLFFGFPPFAYTAHHVDMHHKMENSRDDVSSTAAYVRDNPLHFLHYWARFTFFGYWHLGSWLLRANKADSLRALAIGDVLVHLVMLVALVLNPPAALVVFWIPYVLLKFFLMAGNWSEHAFVDHLDPANPMTNSANLLNTAYNHQTFNAGYHLIHHLVPGLHWADTVPYFQKHLQRMIDEDAILFDGIHDTSTIWWCLMSGNYGYLADHLLDLGDRRPTREGKIAFLKSRVRGRAGVLKGLVERSELAVAAP